MKTKEMFDSLIAELEADEKEVKRIFGQNQQAWERIRESAPKPFDWGALGFTIHTLYGITENYFLRISKFFENGLDRDRWHMSLVEKMALDIPGVRPAVITTKQQKSVVMEILKFRHRFRNLYGEDLDPAKTADIQNIVNDFYGNFNSFHLVFCKKIKMIADRL